MSQCIINILLILWQGAFLQLRSLMTQDKKSLNIYCICCHKTAIQLYHRQQHQILCYLIKSATEQVSKTKTNYQQNQLPRHYFFLYLYLIVYLLMCIILRCHAVASFFFASLQIPSTKWGTSLGCIQIWRQQLLTMPAFPHVNKDRSAVAISTPLKKRVHHKWAHLCILDGMFVLPPNIIC